MPWWREERDESEQSQNGGPTFGSVRVLIVGDSGVGKTSLVHLILRGSSIARPFPTVGCSVGVKHITYRGASSSSNSLKSLKGYAERDFFVELWDISGHDRYKDSRSLFYTQIHGVIFVHDLSQRWTKASLQKWAAEIASTGTFSVPLGSGGPGGLPVPYLVIANKTDITSKEGHGRSGNLVDAARMWVEKQGLLPPSEELPLTDSFPSGLGLIAAAKEARYDKEAVIKFFRKLIQRRYFPDEQPAPSLWSVDSVQSPTHLSGEYLEHDNQLYSSFSEGYKHDALPLLHTQRNLTVQAVLQGHPPTQSCYRDSPQPSHLKLTNSNLKYFE